jgi:hypothetical protein
MAREILGDRPDAKLTEKLAGFQVTVRSAR